MLGRKCECSLSIDTVLEANFDPKQLSGTTTYGGHRDII